MITYEYIEQEYNKALEHAYGLIPARNWSSLPTSLVLTDSPRRLGIADDRTGEVSINARYKNTTAYTSLRNTIFHELAHFCVGTHNNHNKVFKRVLSRFTAHFEVDSSELQQLIKQVDFKWFVVAHLENGQIHEIGGVHRKTKIYAEYPHYRPNAIHTIKGVKVLRYEYRQNR
ncbi:hypothetical protein [Alteromonas stellipolaris]|uniref:hypothetical protein n=1 Tax=Alteromonas stellipolaris TaxID=233316 RepID=UPI001DED1B2C|nr:hypothetical protein [Alteromonas stellipolaris]MBZ2163226.1 hypothetical protein [Alteromonas stellipolaris]